MGRATCTKIYGFENKTKFHVHESKKKNQFKVPPKSFFTRISKQVLYFGICGFKNCKIESEVVNISVGQSVYTVMVGIYESTYLLVWIWQAVVEGSLVEILDE